MVGRLFCAALEGRSERKLFPSWNLLAVPQEKTAPIPEIDVLWITGGLSCDGDTIAMTAATQPSIEDIVLWRASVDSQSQLSQPISRFGKRR